MVQREPTTCSDLDARGQRFDSDRLTVSREECTISSLLDAQYAKNATRVLMDRV
jgi:hypothetical protein